MLFMSWYVLIKLRANMFVPSISISHLGSQHGPCIVTVTW